MRNKRAQILFLTISSLLAGIFMMAVIRSNNIPIKQIDPRNEELIRTIDALELEITTLEEQRRQLNERITAIHEEQSKGESQLSLLNQNLEALRQSAALTELLGPGLIITIDDNQEGAEKARQSSPATYIPEDYIVHDKDLLYVIRAISPVSEGISINNVRLNNNSHIRCVGTVILVNYARLAPPYEIRVLGDPVQLMQALQASTRYQSLLSRMMPVRTATSDELSIPAYSGSYSPSYSKLGKDITASI